MLYYSIDHPDPDNNFTVTVIPINEAGPGESAIKSMQHLSKVIVIVCTCSVLHSILHDSGL